MSRGRETSIAGSTRINLFVQYGGRNRKKGYFPSSAHRGTIDRPPLGTEKLVLEDLGREKGVADIRAKRGTKISTRGAWDWFEGEREWTVGPSESLSL